jgi:hypothetical protein
VFYVPPRIYAFIIRVLPGNFPSKPISKEQVGEAADIFTGFAESFLLVFILDLSLMSGASY